MSGYEADDYKELRMLWGFVYSGEVPQAPILQFSMCGTLAGTE